jgi:hypothetical protein
VTDVSLLALVGAFIMFLREDLGLDFEVWDFSGA